MPNSGELIRGTGMLWEVHLSQCLDDHNDHHEDKVLSSEKLLLSFSIDIMNSSTFSLI